jgi:ribulose-bisphosphate carboxylase large chain
MAEEERIIATYVVRASRGEVEERALDICLEQTVEVTDDLVRDPWIREHIVGRVERIAPLGDDDHEVVISYSEDITGYSIMGLLNVIYGNISLKRGIALRDLELSRTFVSHFRGPRFGIEGIRAMAGVPDRPLLGAPIKPLGKSPEDLASLCYELALGGIDIIKDDHGLANQSFCPFRERVRAVIDALERASIKRGTRALYFPCIMDRSETMEENILWCREQGVGGILISPMIAGMDFMRHIAEDERYGLPLMAHPALTGAFLNDISHGMAHGVLLGTLMRLCGADMVVYPNFLGRFPFTREACAAISEALRCHFHGIRGAFPVPAGGISLSSIPDLREFFGPDTVFLVGSSLFSRSPDIRANAEYFLSIVK